MANVVSIISRHGLTFEAHCRNQPNQSKLALYKPLATSLLQSFKTIDISDKMECFNYKGGCGMHGQMHIEAF